MVNILRPRQKGHSQQLSILNTTLIDCLINVIYKGLQRLEISNVNLAAKLTCLYGDISNHYALNLGYCFCV